MSSTRRNDPEAGTLAAATLLADAVRRRIFRFVRRARRPVTREEAAAAARVSRNLAAFHLDKLVAAGLLRSGTGPTGSSRVGRRPKVYEPGPVEVHLDVPSRQHALLAGLVVETLGAGAGGAEVRSAVVEAARRRGRELGRAARTDAEGSRAPAGVDAVLERLGFEPYEAEPSVVRLANCPFRPLAAAWPDLVCGLNHGLISGLLTGLDAGEVGPVLAPRPGECCVEIRSRA